MVAAVVCLIKIVPVLTKDKSVAAVLLAPVSF